MAKRRNQAKHDSMVELLADFVKEKGYSDIRANLSGYDKPELIHWEGTKKGHFPDLISTKSQDYIFEVETDDSINDSRTEDRWKLFSTDAQAHSKKFIIVVPDGSEAKAGQRVRELGIIANGIWAFG
jgi:hypothetical protein